MKELEKEEEELKQDVENIQYNEEEELEKLKMNFVTQQE